MDLFDLRKFFARYNTFADVESNSTWPSVLAVQERAYLHSEKNEQEEIARYFALGRRRNGIALGAPADHPSPHFGLSDTGLFIRLTSPDLRIQRLREMINLFSDRYSSEKAIIRFLHPKDSMGYQLIEYATLLPQAVEGIPQSVHRRWIVFPNPSDGELGHHSDSSFTAAQLSAIKRSIEIMRNDAEPCGLLFPSTFT